VKHHEHHDHVHIGPVKCPTPAHLIGIIGSHLWKEILDNRSLSCMDENSNVCSEWFESSDAKFRALERGVSLID